MIVIPAIDILEGQLVRLTQGDYSRKKVYSYDPVVVARKWKAIGAQWLHVVDLDGARQGRPVNVDVIKSVIMEFGPQVQVGGGLRTLEDIQSIVELGASRIVLGTSAVKDPEFLREVCAKYPDMVVAALDTRNGVVAIDGWTKSSGLDVLEVAKLVEDAGVGYILFTAIETDGTMTGPDIAAVQRLMSHVSVPVIASGGISEPEDLEELSKAGVYAVIVGKALYEGRLPEEVITTYSAPKEYME